MGAAGRSGKRAWGRLGPGSESHRERSGGADGWGESAESPRKVSRGCGGQNTPGARGAVRKGAAEGGECEESPGGSSRRVSTRPGLSSLAAAGPRSLTMMEKTKATMLMGYAGQKQETMASHR